MEDDSNDLLPSAYAGSIGQPERRSCSRGTVYTAFSILAVLLIAGQAVTAYFMYQHNTQISKITKTTQELKLESMVNNLPQNSKSANPRKVSMANMMPLLMKDPEAPENEIKLTNSTEDQVKRLLMQRNPLIKFPELEKSFMENLADLRERMNFEDWKSFEVWMHMWLLFQMAQNEIPGEGVKTKCQEEECSKGVHPGRFCAQCDENGDYLPRQCHHSTGFCWCVYKNGTMVEGGIKVRGPLNCTETVDTLDPKNGTYLELNFTS